MTLATIACIIWVFYYTHTNFMNWAPFYMSVVKAYALPMHELSQHALSFPKLEIGPIFIYLNLRGTIIVVSRERCSAARGAATFYAAGRERAPGEGV